MPGKSDKKSTGDDKRSYFRIDDVIPLVAVPVEIEDVKCEELTAKISSSKAFSMAGAGNSPANDENETALTTNYEKSGTDKLHDDIADIKAKLDYIINHFIMEKEGLANPEKKVVNISASGIRFIVNHPVELNDVMEIKLLLPTYPPVAVFVHGEVKRVDRLDDNKYEIAIEYLNMSDSVRNEIIQYTLSHQRETIRKYKETGADE